MDVVRNQSQQRESSGEFDWSFRSEEKIDIRTNKSVKEVPNMTFNDILVVHFFLRNHLSFHATKILVNFTINEYLVGYCIIFKDSKYLQEK